MKQVGYIIRHLKIKNGKEYEYFYLRRSDRFKTSGESKEKRTYLYSFGNRKKALAQLDSWENDLGIIPKELTELGYSLEDVKKWKQEIESK
ncbi:hypothetical protein [Lysinibacillus fusiformis]|uniref:hypothetical protein n=1 Tax=Lysinibacillus fusiformis TaxID=28031 RepID=UPI003D08AF44